MNFLTAEQAKHLHEIGVELVFPNTWYVREDETKPWHIEVNNPEIEVHAEQWTTEEFEKHYCPAYTAEDLINASDDLSWTYRPNVLTYKNNKDVTYILSDNTLPELLYEMLCNVYK